MNDENPIPMPNEDNAPAAVEALRDFLIEDGWHPSQIEDKPIFRMTFAGKNAQYACFAQINLEMQQFLFYSQAPIKAPEAIRPAAAEFITRANYGLRIGNFEMDFSDGELRYKSSVDFEGIELSAPLLKNTIYPCVQTMDRYFPGLMSVIYGGKTPVDAISEIEK